MGLARYTNEDDTLLILFHAGEKSCAFHLPPPPGRRWELILGTCNRTEIYCLSSKGGPDTVTDWIYRTNAIPDGQLEGHIYAHEGEETARHLVRVASGLDSLVLGEPQILGQVKSAFQTAHEAGRTGKVLTRLFQHAFSTAKQVRTDTAIGDSPVSVAFAAVSLARQIFADLSEQTALLIGAGEMAELAVEHLIRRRCGEIWVANRTFERAVKLAEKFTPDAVDVASGLNIAAFNVGIALGSCGGGMIVSDMGLMHTPWIGALIVLLALVLTRMSGRLDRRTESQWEQESVFVK